MPFTRLATATTPTCHLGLGLAAVARPGYINLDRDDDLGDDRSVEALRTRTHELLDAAYAQGVRYIDVARSYGRSEEFLADWLNARPDIDDVVIGSKWGYTYTADWTTDAERHEVKDHSLPTYERQRAETGRAARRPARPLPDPLADPRQPGPVGQGTPRPSRGGRRGGPDRRLLHQRPRPGRHRPRRPRRDGRRRAPLPYRPVDVQRPGDLRRARAGRGPRRRTDGDRQGGHGQRPPRRRAGARHRTGDRRGDGTGRGRRRPRGGAAPAMGRGGAVRRGHGGPARRRICTRRSSTSTRTTLARLAALVEEPRAYWERRGQLPWH